MMKKTAAVFTAVIMMIITAAVMLPSCERKTEPVYEFDIESLAAQIVGQTTFKDELVRLDDERAAQIYPWGGIKTVAYAGSGATAEVVILKEYEDSAAAEAAQSAMRSYIENQKIMYTDYNASELPKIENALCAVRGRYIICVISEDNTPAEAAVSGEIRN